MNKCHAFPSLRRGMSGPEVCDLQRRLRRQDLDLLVDGFFGPATELAVKVYQTGQGLVPDGIAGPVTFAQFSETG